MSAQVGDVQRPPLSVSDKFGVVAERSLGGRASENWLVRQRGRPLVLRGHRPADWQSSEQLSAAIGWRSRARLQVRELGWPAARPIGQPTFHSGVWWSLEEFLPGCVRQLPPRRHAELLTAFHALGVDVDLLGVQPGRLNHLAVLDDDLAEATIAGCDDLDDRRWLRRRLVQARDLAEGIDWSASKCVLVHGDFAAHNLLFDASELTGLLDFELATIDRRVVDLIHVWRCRHDDVLLGFDAITPLTHDEWRMLLVDWWSLMISLAVLQLRAGRPPGRWELDGLRRTSALSSRLEATSGSASADRSAKRR